MKDEQEPRPDSQDNEHKVGEQNIQVFGLDIHNPVFVVSALLVIVFVIATLLFLDQAQAYSPICASG